MNLSDVCGELMRAGFGVLETYAAQFGPSVLARNGPEHVGVGDANLRHGQEQTSWANQLEACNSRGGFTGDGDRSLLGLVPPKNGADDKNGPPPVEDGNDLSEVEYE